MGPRLRQLKTKLGEKQLGDGKPIGGRNRLTDDAIDRLQRYYGLCIRQNKSVSDIRKAIWHCFFTYYVNRCKT